MISNEADKKLWAGNSQLTLKPVCTDGMSPIFNFQLLGLSPDEPKPVKINYDLISVLV